MTLYSFFINAFLYCFLFLIICFYNLVLFFRLCEGGELLDRILARYFFVYWL